MNITYVTLGVGIGLAIIVLCWVLKKKLPDTKTALVLFLMGQMIVGGMLSISYGLFGTYIIDVGEGFQYVQAFGGVAMLWIGYETIKREMNK